MKKRSNVVLEIVNTEKDYVQDLCIIRDVYFKHLDRERVVSTENLNQIFSNVEQLYEVNNQVQSYVLLWDLTLSCSYFSRWRSGVPPPQILLSSCWEISS